MPQSDPNVAAVADSLRILEHPIKSPQGAEYAEVVKLREQARIADESCVLVDYNEVNGTCIDERERVGLLNGDPVVEPRPSAAGGPNIYALGVAELIGYFEDDSTSGEDRLANITGRLIDGRIKSGGHVDCKANAAIAGWMEIIATNPEYVKNYARLRFGEAFNESLMNEVVSNAKKVVESGRYAGWTESVLPKVLGDDAGTSVEKLAKVKHNGKAIVRNWRDQTTVDQNAVYARNEQGEGVGLGSFVNDEMYCDKIEHIVSSGPDAVHKKQVAEYAREAILAALAEAVPNETLYQIDLLPAAA